MEQQPYQTDMLDLLFQPSFYVQNGVITRVNRDAARRLLEPGTPISDILETGAEEYSHFQGGELYLFLNIAGAVIGATVTRVNDQDVFLLDRSKEREVFEALSLAAQEIREPLSTVTAVSGKLLPTPPEDPGNRITRQLTQYNRSLYKLLRLVGNMAYLEFSDKETTHENEVGNIRAYFSELNTTVKALLSEGNRELLYRELPEDLYCYFNRELLERAYLNLVSNAIKFSPDGSRIQVSLTRRRSTLYLTVQNQPDGCPGNLFFAGPRREPGISDGRCGIGLGMVLVRSAARIHGGTVLVQQTDTATAVTLTLRIKEAGSVEAFSNKLDFDYSGCWDHSLLELSDALPAKLYTSF